MYVLCCNENNILKIQLLHQTAAVQTPNWWEHHCHCQWQLSQALCSSLKNCTSHPAFERLFCSFGMTERVLDTRREWAKSSQRDRIQTSDDSRSTPPLSLFFSHPQPSTPTHALGVSLPATSPPDIWIHEPDPNGRFGSAAKDEIHDWIQTAATPQLQLRAWPLRWCICHTGSRT